jgi:hypothetical protein
MLDHEKYEHEYDNNDMDENNFEYMGERRKLMVQMSLLVR